MQIGPQFEYIISHRFTVFPTHFFPQRSSRSQTHQKSTSSTSNNDLSKWLQQNACKRERERRDSADRTYHKWVRIYQTFTASHQRISSAIQQVAARCRWSKTFSRISGQLTELSLAWSGHRCIVTKIYNLLFTHALQRLFQAECSVTSKAAFIASIILS